MVGYAIRSPEIVSKLTVGTQTSLIRFVPQTAQIISGIYLATADKSK